METYLLAAARTRRWNKGRLNRLLTAMTTHITVAEHLEYSSATDKLEAYIRLSLPVGSFREKSVSTSSNTEIKKAEDSLLTNGVFAVKINDYRRNHSGNIPLKDGSFITFNQKEGQDEKTMVYRGKDTGLWFSSRSPVSLFHNYIIKTAYLDDGILYRILDLNKLDSQDPSKPFKFDLTTEHSGSTSKSILCEVRTRSLWWANNYSLFHDSKMMMALDHNEMRHTIVNPLVAKHCYGALSHLDDEYYPSKRFHSVVLKSKKSHKEIANYKQMNAEGDYLSIVGVWSANFKVDVLLFQNNSYLLRSAPGRYQWGRYANS